METFFIVLLYVVILACTVDSVLNTIFSNLQRRYKDEILQSNATLKKGLDDFISLLREAEAERDALKKRKAGPK